jgi:hypothetical protein
LTAPQLVVLALLAAAFAAGWAAGRNGSGSRRSRALLRAADCASAAVADALAAYEAARANADPDAGRRYRVAVNRLKAESDALLAEAGDENPLAQEFGHAAKALAMLVDDGQPGGSEADRALERVARDSSLRAQRTVRTLRGL